MITVAALSVFAGLVLGLSSNIRMFILVVFVIVLATFLAGNFDGTFLRGVGWACTGLVATQIGYVLMIIGRAAWATALTRLRQPVPY